MNKICKFSIGEWEFLGSLLLQAGRGFKPFSLMQRPRNSVQGLKVAKHSAGCSCFTCSQASRQSCKTCAYGLPCRTHGPVSCSCSHGSTCQLHSTSQSCGTCSAGLACHAHPRSQASCRCHQGFQCQLHGSNAIQKCRQCASNLTCHAHAQPQAEAEQPPSRRGLLRNTAAGVAAICFLSE